MVLGKLHCQEIRGRLIMITDELLAHYQTEPELPDNILEMSDVEQAEYQQSCLDWLIRRIELGNFDDFTHRDNLNKLKNKLEYRTGK